MKLRSLGLLAVVALIVASCGGGAPEAAAPSEGIQVHGDWTVDVYNPDGSLDQHREFSNALTEFGVEILLNNLTAQPAYPITALGAGGTVAWVIFIGANDPSDPPCDSPNLAEGGPESASSGCAIHDGSPIVHGSLDPDVVPDSTDIALSTDYDTQALELTGSVVAERDGIVDFVQTQVEWSSYGEGTWVFTATDIDPIDVTADQIMQVEVDISFTSG